LGIAEQAIGPPIQALLAFEANRVERKRQLSRDKSELDSLQARLPGLRAGTVAQLEVFIVASRFGVALILCLLVGIVTSAWRFVLRLTAHYDARADAVALANASLDHDFHQLVRTFASLGVDFGKSELSPAEQVLEAVRGMPRRRDKS